MELQRDTEEEALGRDGGRFRFLTVPLGLLLDADAAVQLTLGVVVVDVGVGVGVGVAAAHVGCRHGRRAACVVGATVLEQDVCTLLAARTPSVGERRLAASIATLHIHTVLQEGATDMKGRVDIKILQSIVQ